MDQEVEECLLDMRRIVEKACPEITYKSHRYFPAKTHPLFNTSAEPTYRGFLLVNCERLICEKRGDIYANVRLKEDYHIRIYEDSLSYNRFEEREIVDAMINSIVERRKQKEIFARELSAELASVCRLESSTPVLNH